MIVRGPRAQIRSKLQQTQQFWAGTWIDIDLYAGMTGLDSFETYPDDEDINDLNDGTGFAGAWVDPGLTISS